MTLGRHRPHAHMYSVKIHLKDLIAASRKKYHQTITLIKKLLGKQLKVASISSLNRPLGSFEFEPLPIHESEDLKNPSPYTSDSQPFLGYDTF
jgi:hypothetical protein